MKKERLVLKKAKGLVKKWYTMYAKYRTKYEQCCIFAMERI
jgi:hypothetical protein